MTAGYRAWREAQGVTFSPVYQWPIEWINFRIHPCPHWPGVARYLDMILNGEEIEPVVLCKDCFVIEDGWHRVAAYWLEGRRTVPVVFANEHYPLGRKDRCYVEETYHMDKLRPYVDLPFVSGAFRESDFSVPAFADIVQSLTEKYREAGRGMPHMRFWEQARALAFLGNVNNKSILDVGTRESMVPEWLADRGAEVCAVDAAKGFSEIVPVQTQVQYRIADARDLPFPDETFDFVLCTACIKHIPGWGDRGAVREMLRVLKPHGKLALSFDYGPTYESYPSRVSGRRIYDEASVQKRLVLGKEIGPSDWSVDWDAPKDTWPIKTHANSIWQKGYNLQVGFLLQEK